MATASRPAAPPSPAEAKPRKRAVGQRKALAAEAMQTLAAQTPAPATAAAARTPAPFAVSVAKATRRPRKAAPAPEQVPMPASSAPHAALTEDQRQHCVSVAAFYIAERRGFTLGDPVQDWLDAEAEIDRLIASGHFVF